MTATAHLEALHDTVRTDQLIAATDVHPLLLFKHSRTCGTSMQAFEELEAFLADADPRLTCALVTIQTDRAVSDHIASRFGLRHQSPQAILVRAGEVAWTASHFRITAEALARAVREALSAPLDEPEAARR